MLLTCHVIVTFKEQDFTKIILHNILHGVNIFVTPYNFFIEW